MRFFKRGVAVVLSAAMVITMAPSNFADAAKKKPKLNITAKEVKKGDKVKLKIKNGNKKAKVTWKASGKKIVKLASKKGLNNTVTALKEGKSKITATYKLGKKKPSNLVCNITVKPDEAPAAVTDVPVVATQPPVVPPVITDPPVLPPAATDVPTVKATKTPRPTSTPGPTDVPVDDSVKFDAVSGTKLDNSAYEAISGNSKYIKDKDAVQVNDPANQSHGFWPIPDSIKLGVDDIVTVRVQGFFKGTQTLRFWIGNRNYGGCTPVELVSSIAEGRGMKAEYPCCYDAEGNALADLKGSDIQKMEGVVTNNQMLLGADKETGKFDVTFKLKLGTSQNDCKNDKNVSSFPEFVIKGLIDTNIDGLVLKNVYITDVKKYTPPTPVPDVAEGYDRYELVDSVEDGGNYIVLFNNSIVAGEAETNAGDLWALDGVNQKDKFTVLKSDAFAGDRSYVDIARTEDIKKIAWSFKADADGKGYFVTNVKTSQFLSVNGSNLAFEEGGTKKWKLVDRVAEANDTPNYNITTFTVVDDNDNAEDDQFIRFSTQGSGTFKLGSASKLYGDKTPDENGTNGRNGNAYIYKIPDGVDLTDETEDPGNQDTDKVIRYELVTSIEDGGEYMFLFNKSGEAPAGMTNAGDLWALSSNNDKKEKAEVANNIIESDRSCIKIQEEDVNDAIVWIVSGDETNGYKLENKQSGKYLAKSDDNSTIAYVDGADSATNWNLVDKIGEPGSTPTYPITTLTAVDGDENGDNDLFVRFKYSSSTFSLGNLPGSPMNGRGGNVYIYKLVKEEEE